MGRFIRQYKFPLLVIITSVVVAALPLVSVLVSSLLAAIADCPLNEGTVNACQLGSFEIGELLYTLFVAGWLMFVSIPLGMLGVGLGFLLLVVQLMIRSNPQNRDRS